MTRPGEVVKPGCDPMGFRQLFLSHFHRYGNQKATCSIHNPNWLNRLVKDALLFFGEDELDHACILSTIIRNCPEVNCPTGS